MMNTWVDAVGARLEMLGATEAASDRMKRGFEQVALEWARLAREDGMPFASGITADGSPVEVSVRLPHRGGASAVRFIAQPGRLREPALAEPHWKCRRALDFVERWCGSRAKLAISPIVDLLRSCRHAASGNFLLWLGLSEEPGEDVVGKLYVNPWVFGEGADGVVLLEGILRAASLGSSLPAFERLVRGYPTAQLQIIGLNLDAGGVRDVKAYVVLASASPREVMSLTELFSETEPLKAAFRAMGIDYFRDDFSAQVHSALTWRRGHRTAELRSSLYCPGWFSSDAQVVDVARTLCGATSLAVGKGCEARDFTFLGIENDSITLYSRV